MEQLLAIAGLRAPWLPPLWTEINQERERIYLELKEYRDPGDGLPTLEWMTATIERLRTLYDLAATIEDEHHRKDTNKALGWAWADALALNERVQTSHAAE